MRQLTFLLVVLGAASALAGSRARGYVKKNGTYVAPSYRSAPNGTPIDNYGSQGNVNPYTGKKGTKNPYTPKK